MTSRSLGDFKEFQMDFIKFLMIFFWRITKTILGDFGQAEQLMVSFERRRPIDRNRISLKFEVALWWERIDWRCLETFVFQMFDPSVQVFL